MKKIFMIFVYLMTMVLSVNAQGISLNQIRLNAVNYIKRNLIAPSTFVLVDELGNKVNINTIKVKRLKEEIKTDSSCFTRKKCCPSEVVEEKFFEGDSTNIIHTATYNLDYYVCCEKEYHTKRYYECYEVSFYYEAQNRLGGKVQKFVSMYVPIDGELCYLLEYDTRNYETIEKWTKTIHSDYKKEVKVLFTTYTELPKGWDRLYLLKKIREGRKKYEIMF